jgi:hypothetical protein
MTAATMAENRRGSAGRYVGLVTTATASLGAAAAIGWAAATPVGGAKAAPTTTVTPASTRTTEQLDAARAQLQQVRLELARMLSQEDELPRVTFANLPALPTRLPAVQVPQPSSQLTAPAVTPPVTHTTTGASGVRP